MPDYRLGQLKGQWVVTWYDGTGTRRRIRLFEASEGTRTRRQAEDRLADFVRAQTAGAVPTVASLWEAYRQDKTGRRVADKMRSEWKLFAIGAPPKEAEARQHQSCTSYGAGEIPVQNKELEP